MERDFAFESGTLRRRQLLAGAAAFAATAAVGAEAGKADEHQHGEAHGAPAAKRYTTAVAYRRHAAATAAAQECIGTGRACLSHCFETFVAGDTTMAECARSVDEMLRVCDAFAWLAATDSKQLAPMARACIASCEYCEKECRVHEEHQAECKACADACAALVIEAKKLLA